MVNTLQASEFLKSDVINKKAEPPSTVVNSHLTGTTRNSFRYFRVVRHTHIGADAT